MQKTLCLLAVFAILTCIACEEAPPRLSLSTDAGRDARADTGTDGTIEVDAMPPMDASPIDSGSTIITDGGVMDSAMPNNDAGLDAGYDAGFDAGLPFGPGQCNPGYPESYSASCDCFCYTSTIETADCQSGSSARCQTQEMVTDGGVRKNYCFPDTDAGTFYNACGWSLAAPLSLDYLACDSEFLSRAWGVYVGGVATGETCTGVYEWLNGQRYYSLRCTGSPTVANHELGWLPNLQCGVSNGLGCIGNGANADLYAADGGTLTREGYKFTVSFNVNCTQATVRAINPITQSQLWFVIIK